MNSGVASFPYVFTEIRVVFGKTGHPIYEVLQDVEAVIEPSGWTSRNAQDPSADFYVVTFLLEDRQPPDRVTVARGVQDDDG